MTDRAALARSRARRWRAPALLAVWALLAVEAVGGLVIFAARLAFGTTPGETLHVIAGLALTVAYVVYQWRHWLRVRPFLPRLDYALGLFSASFMALSLLTGLALGVVWWRDRASGTGAVRYPTVLSATHLIGSMLVLTFIGAHIGAVLLRTRKLNRKGT
jgi:hypothetical protein